MIFLIFYLLFISPIVYFTSRKRSMSFGWGLFFCAFYSLIPGIIIILSSGKKGYSNKYKNKGTGWHDTKTVLCMLFGSFLIIYGFVYYNSYQFEYNKSGIYMFISIGIGLIGNCIYLLSDEDEEYILLDSEDIQENITE